MTYMVQEDQERKCDRTFSNIHFGLYHSACYVILQQ
jgi:hypothetical protein